MASGGNIGLTRLPWGKLPRSPVSSKRGAGPSQMEMSFQDIMAEQEKESQLSPDKDFEEYVEKSFVKVGKVTGTIAAPEKSKEVVVPPKKEEEVDVDPKLVMSLYEDQDFEDAAYEISEHELNEMADDDTDNYYEGLARKLSTVVEIQSPALSTSRMNKGNRTTTSCSIRQMDPETVIDPQSKVIFDKLKRKGILREPLASSASDKVIHMGRSATLVHALGGMLKRRDDSSSSSISIVKLRLPKECAVKVFRVRGAADSKNIQGQSCDQSQSCMDAMKEMTNLNRMARSGIPCPQVQFICRNVLVMEFLGKDGVPAKQLKSVNDLSSSRSVLKSAYEQVTNNMKTLFKTCHLVHGDLSESKILWHKRQAYFIGVGNALNSNKPKALEYLYQDCVNISQFFEKKGTIGCRQPHQLFHWITGFDYTGEYPEAAASTCDDEDFTIV